MGSKPSTTAHASKNANNKNNEQTQKNDNIDQKEQSQPKPQPQPKAAAEVSPSKSDEKPVEETDAVVPMQKPTSPSTSDEEMETVIPMKKNRKVTMTEHISLAEKDDDGRKRINQYVFLELIGQGEYGKVKKCINKTTGEVCACKIMRKSMLKRKRVGRFGNELQNVKREIAVWKKLSHPNVLQCLEVIDDPEVDKIYLISELASGGACMENAVTCTPLKEEQARRWSGMMIQGLQYLHFNNIIHRDVKPANLLVHTRDGQEVIKVGDFGLSHEVEPNSTVSNTVGTTAFMPPEMFMEEQFDGKKCDVWSAGATIYMFVFGCLPWNIETQWEAGEVLQKFSLTFPENVDPQLQDLLRQMLEKDPNKRPPFSKLLDHPWLLGVDRKLNKPSSESLVPISVSSDDIANALTKRMSTVFNKARTMVGVVRCLRNAAFATSKSTENADVVLTESMD